MNKQPGSGSAMASSSQVRSREKSGFDSRRPLSTSIVSRPVSAWFGLDREFPRC